MKSKNAIFLLSCLFALSSCSVADMGEPQTSSVPIISDTVDSSVTEDNIFSDNTLDNTEINLPETQETILQTVPLEYTQELIDSVNYPNININENSAPEEIIQSGKIAAKFFAEQTEIYFEYGVEQLWNISFKDGDIFNDVLFENGGRNTYHTAGVYRKSLGLYTDAETKDTYVPMNGEESKQFLIDYLRLTKKGYEELCLNSPSAYTIKDRDFYVSSGDGGQAGWSYSQIIDYSFGVNEIDQKTVTFNCERVGTAEEWGYDNDLVKPFTFRLAFEEGIWKLDGVSYGEGFFELMWLNME